MMIGDDEVESRGWAAASAAAKSRMPVSTLMTRLTPCSAAAGQHCRLHPVALANAVGYMEIHLTAEHLDGRLEQHDGGGAIHVIIAVDEDGLAPVNGRLHPGNGRCHAVHRVGIEQVFDAGVEENVRLGCSAHAALRQQLGDDEGKSGALRQRRCRGNVRLGQDPGSVAGPWVAA